MRRSALTHLGIHAICADTLADGVAVTDPHPASYTHAIAVPYHDANPGTGTRVGRVA
jgi:hypothetical protein